MASKDYVFILGCHPIKDDGLPHSDTPGSKPVDGSPRIVAVFRVLHSLPMPRHPSCARIRLARNFFELSPISLRCNSLQSPTPTFQRSRPALCGANEDIVYHFTAPLRKGVFELLLKFFTMQQFNPIIRQFSQHKNCRPAAKQPPFLLQRGEMLRVCRLFENVLSAFALNYIDMVLSHL